jgi:hypothetical protein
MGGVLHHERRPEFVEPDNLISAGAIRLRAPESNPEILALSQLRSCAATKVDALEKV